MTIVFLLQSLGSAALAAFLFCPPALMEGVPADALALAPAWFDEAEALFDAYEARDAREERAAHGLWMRALLEHESEKHFYTTRLQRPYQPVPQGWAAYPSRSHVAVQFRWVGESQDAALVFVPTRAGAPLLHVAGALLGHAPPDPRAAVVLHYLHALYAWQEALVPVPRLLHEAVDALPLEAAVPTALGDVVGRVERYDAARHETHIARYVCIAHQPWPGNGWTAWTGSSSSSSSSSSSK